MIVCPGSHNNTWRTAEQKLAEQGTPHELQPTWGQPVHCTRCTDRARTELAALPELVAAIWLEAVHGTAAKQTGTIGRINIPAWPGQASRLLTDLIVGGMLALEDDIREQRRLRIRPGRGTEGAAVTASVTFLNAHLDWALEQHPLAEEPHDRLSGNPGSQIHGWHRMALRFTRRDPRIEHHRVPCPRCEMLTLFRADGDDYIECRNVACELLVTPAELDAHRKKLTVEYRQVQAA